MDNYYVYGNPIKQSRSPYIHQQFARQTEQNLCYSAQLVATNKFTQQVKDAVRLGAKGANVTVPFKEQALLLCDHLSERAKQAGAVNTLSFKNGFIHGDNTDGLGLVYDLIRNKVVLNDIKILILGAGGAVRGIILPLLEQQVNEIVIANRTLSKVQNLCAQFTDKRITACGFEDIPLQTYDLIINGTSASLSGNIPAISTQLININTVCYDMVYGDTLTPFLQWAKQNKAKQVVDGLGMLVAQAAESFYIWRGIKPESGEVLNQLRAELVSVSSSEQVK
jgi:shikimate dehydrogenase